MPDQRCAARLLAPDGPSYIYCSRAPVTSILGHGREYRVCRQHATVGPRRGLWLTMSNGIVDWVVPRAIEDVAALMREGYEEGAEEAREWAEQMFPLAREVLDQ